MTGSSVGTVTHMSPEILEGKRYSFGHDIYSLAILLWELWYGCHVYSEAEYDTVPVYQLMDAIKAGRRPQFNKRFAPFDELKKLIYQCWASDPEERPNALQVQNNLKAIYKFYYDQDISSQARMKSAVTETESQILYNRDKHV